MFKTCSSCQQDLVTSLIRFAIMTVTSSIRTTPRGELMATWLTTDGEYMYICASVAWACASCVCNKKVIPDLSSIQVARDLPAHHCVPHQEQSILMYEHEYLSAQMVQVCA